MRALGGRLCAPTLFFALPYGFKAPLTSQEPQAVLQAAKAEATSFGRKKRAKVEFGV